MDKKTTKKATKAQRERITRMLGAGLIDRVEAQEIIAKPRDWALPLDHYDVRVTYAPIRSKEDLEKKFPDSTGGRGSTVSNFSFDGSFWRRHASCAKINVTPGSRIFWLAEVPRKFVGQCIRHSWDDLAAYFDSRGYRFAIETEVVDFVVAHPELQCEGQILSLGSFDPNIDQEPILVLLDTLPFGRCFHHYWFEHVLRDEFRLLLVRKDHEAA